MLSLGIALAVGIGVGRTREVNVCLRAEGEGRGDRKEDGTNECVWPMDNGTEVERDSGEQLEVARIYLIVGE